MNLEQCRNIWDAFMAPKWGCFPHATNAPHAIPRKKGCLKKQAGGS